MIMNALYQLPLKNVAITIFTVPKVHTLEIFLETMHSMLEFWPRLPFGKDEFAAKPCHFDGMPQHLWADIPWSSLSSRI